MKFSFVKVLVLALASTELAAASSWFPKAGMLVAFLPELNIADHSPAYNKWHETELERWLSDNNIPYPTPSDRKDLENLVKSNWQSKVALPYNDWDRQQLSAYLKQKGVETKDTAAEN